MSASHAAPGERLEALVRWLAADLGPTPGPCPSNAVIAERVGLASYNQATNLLTCAQNAGLIAFETARQHQQRVVRVLPAGLDMVTRRIAPPSPPAPRFADWLATARPGDRYTYFIGHLAETRGVVPRLQGATLGESLSVLARCVASVSSHTTDPEAALRLMTDKAAAELHAQQRARAAFAARLENPYGHP